MNELKRLEVFSLRYVKEQSVPYMDYMEENPVSSPSKVAEIMNDIFELDERAEEYFYILCLNTKNQITSISEVSHGTINASLVRPAEVFKRALMANANSLILVHNHPSGMTSPSKEDRDITKRLQEGGELLALRVLDHVIIGHNDYFSFKEHGMI